MASEAKRQKMPNHYYQPTWEEEFFVTSFGDTCACIVCGNVFRMNKKSNVQRHFLTKHNHLDVDFPKNSPTRSLQIEALKADLLSKTSIDSNNFVKSDANSTTRLSFKIAYMLARAMKPLDDGKIIKTAMFEMANELLNDGEAKNSFLKKIENTPLSRQTITRRVEGISDDIREQLLKDLQNSAWFSLRLDESTDVGDTAQLGVQIRMVFDDHSTTEELLSIITLQGRTTGKDIFCALKNYLVEKKVPLEKLVSITTDGAPAMIERQAELIALCREDLIFHPSMLNYHCIIHQQALCVKSVDMSHVMQPVVKIVNSIRARPLQHRLFRLLLQEVGADHNDLLLHTEMKWLSHGKVLKRFCEALPAIREFLKTRNEDIKELNEESWLLDLAFFADLMDFVSRLNLKLQGRNIPIWASVTHVMDFRIELRVWAQSFREGETFYSFENLIKAQQQSGALTDACRERFVRYLEKLASEFEKRFQDFKDISKLRKYFCQPMIEEDDRGIAATIAGLFPALNHMRIREEMALLRNSEMECFRFAKGIHPDEFWKTVDKTRFSSLLSLYKRLLSCFGSSDLCESVFSSMKHVKSKLRSRFTDVHLENLIRICVSSYEPQFEGLVQDSRNRRQSEGSG